MLITQNISKTRVRGASLTHIVNILGISPSVIYGNKIQKLSLVVANIIIANDLCIIFSGYLFYLIIIQ